MTLRLRDQQEVTWYFEQYIYLPFDNTYGHYTWQGAEFREEFQQANT